MTFAKGSENLVDIKIMNGTSSTLDLVIADIKGIAITSGQGPAGKVCRADNGAFGCQGLHLTPNSVVTYRVTTAAPVPTDAGGTLLLCPREVGRGSLV